MKKEAGSGPLTSENVHRLDLGGRQLILVAPPMFPASAAEVEAIIESEKPIRSASSSARPATGRYRCRALEKNRYRQDHQERKALLLLANLVLSSYQKRLAKNSASTRARR